MMTDDKLKSLAKALEGSIFYDFIDDIKTKLADVRNDFGLDVEARKMLIAVLDELIVQRLKTLAQTNEKPKDNWK